MGLYSQTFYQNKRVLRRSIYIEPGWSPPVRNATYLQTFFRIYLCLSRDFVNKHVFLLLDLHWNSAKLPWGMQRICGPFVLRTIIMPFKRFLSCDTRSLDLCILFKFILIFFIPLTHFAPFFRFSYILLYTNFCVCILPREIVFLFLTTLCSEFYYYF